MVNTYFAAKSDMASCLVPELNQLCLDQVRQTLVKKLTRPGVIILGAQWNCLNETVLLNTQNIETYVLGTQKSCLNVTVLLSSHSIWFWLGDMKHDSSLGTLIWRTVKLVCRCQLDIFLTGGQGQ